MEYAKRETRKFARLVARHVVEDREVHDTVLSRKELGLATINEVVVRGEERAIRLCDVVSSGDWSRTSPGLEVPDAAFGTGGSNAFIEEGPFCLFDGVEELFAIVTAAICTECV